MKKRCSRRRVLQVEQCEGRLSMSMVTVGMLPSTDPLSEYQVPTYPYYPIGNPTAIETPGGTGTIYIPSTPPGGNRIFVP